MHPPESGREGAAAAVEAEARSRVYALLGRALLDPPDGRLLATLGDTVLPALGALRSAPGSPPVLARGIDRLAPLLSADARARTLGNAATEFSGLLRGIRAGSSPPPPYESLYRGGGALFSEVTVEVTREYRSLGLAPAGAHANEPPDHLGLELQYVAGLCEREARAIEEGDARAAEDAAARGVRFLAGHVRPWLPRLREEVEPRDPSGFYTGVLEIAEGWAGRDLARAREREVAP